MPAQDGTLLRGALRVIGAILISTIALLLLMVLLFPGAIRAACAQTSLGAPAATAEPPAVGLFFRAEIRRSHYKPVTPQPATSASNIHPAQLVGSSRRRLERY